MWGNTDEAAFVIRSFRPKHELKGQTGADADKDFGAGLNSYIIPFLLRGAFWVPTLENSKKKLKNCLFSNFLHMTQKL